VHVNVRSVGVGRVGVCMLCVDNNEQRERGVGAGVNATMLSETLLSRRVRRSCPKGGMFAKKTHELVCMR
jgi:hypothetical protein